MKRIGSNLLCVFAIAVHYSHGSIYTVTHANDDHEQSYHRGRSDTSLSMRELQLNVITKLELINAKSDQKIMDIVDGQIIEIKNIVGMSQPAFNINAVSTGKSVKFGYNSIKVFRTENSAPFAFCGNSGPDYYTCTELGYGVHTVTATPFTSSIAGPMVTVTFTIISENPASPPVSAPITVPAPLPVPTPAPIPITAPIPVPAPTPIPIPVPISVPSPVSTQVPVPAPTPVFVPVPVPVPQSVQPAIHTLRLMYTAVSPSTPVVDLTFDSVNVIDLQLLNLQSKQFNIDALVGPGVKSVVFSNGRVETAAPLAYCGNSGNTFYPCDNLVEGSNTTVTVTAYPEAGGVGAPILTRSTTIRIIRTLPPAAPTPPTVAPTAAPTRPPVPGCPVPKLTGSWEGVSNGSTKPYPITVAEAQGTMIGQDFIITSGFKNGYTNATPETYAINMNATGAYWRRMDDMPFPIGLTHLGVAVKGMKAYFCGGYVGGALGIHNGSCFQYDHSIQPGNGQQWTNFSSLPDGGRSGGGMIYDSTMDALFYSAGSQRPFSGRSGAFDFNETWMYSLTNPNAGWVRKADIPFTGNHMNFVTAFDENGSERHYFFGGQAGDHEETGNTDKMYEYNAITNTWIKRQNIPYPLGHAAATARAIGCGFIVSGGRINSGLTSAISYYDIPTNTWTKIGDLTHQIHTNVCVVANGFLRCETGWATGTFSWRRGITL